MLRRLTLCLSIISVIIFPLFFASKTFAAVPTSLTDLSDQMGQTGLTKDLQDFCKKRQGNQMNLETWYSGKCTDETFSGEGVGFSDIVILDLAERLTGKSDPNKSFINVLLDLVKAVQTSAYNPTKSTLAQQQLFIDDARQKLIFNQNSSGLVGQVGNMIGMLYKNQPSSTASYIAYITHNLQEHKVVPNAYAAAIDQGIGFATFSPFLTIWVAIRNLAYLALVVFFIVYGFMMMFRVNLGQKTVISVQLAIPKLIVTLLIITFSYAIVGLMYDLMWVVISFIFGYFTSVGIIVPSGIWNPAVFASGASKAGLIGSMVLNGIISGPAAIFGVLNLVLGGVGSALLTVGSMLTGVGEVVWIIIIIAVLISYGKLFFKLISAFITIVISLITAPVILLGNAFPGSKVIGTWSRNIMANLSVFPVTMLFLFFSYLLMIQPLLGICSNSLDAVIVAIGGTGGTCASLFGVQQLIPNGNSGIYGVPLITNALGVNTYGLLALIGVGLLLMASKYVDIVRDALKVPPFKYGTDIGNALKSGLKATNTVADMNPNPTFTKDVLKTVNKGVDATKGL